MNSHSIVLGLCLIASLIILIRAIWLFQKTKRVEHVPSINDVSLLETVALICIIIIPVWLMPIVRKFVLDLSAVWKIGFLSLASFLIVIILVIVVNVKNRT